MGLAPINDAYAATTFVDAFDVSGQDTNPKNAVFNSDGTKMFVAGAIGDDINEYACTTGFDVSTCSFTDAFSVSGQETNPWGIAFNSDGTKMFVTGNISDNANEYACTTGFDVSTCSFTEAFDVSAQESQPNGIAFNSDGTKMFVAGSSGDDVNEYACTAFDVSTCSFTDAFDVSAQETGPSGVSFNSDGTKMFITGPVGDDVNEYTLSVGFDLNVAAAEEENSSSVCYDCIPPTLQKAHITISTNDYVVATGDDPLHITANVGDKVTIILNVTDNKPVDDFKFAGLYTNYQDKPDSMNTYYANNYNNLKQVSTSFYEWNIRADDVAYDYDGTVSWSENFPTIVTDEITEDNYFMINDDNVLEYFSMPFTFTMNNSMESTQIIAKVYDGSHNRLLVTLPVTLEIIPQKTVVLSDAEEIAALDEGIVDTIPSEDPIPLLNEPVLLTVLSQWSGYSKVTSDDAEVLSSLGLQGDSLPAWTKNLGEWVIQEKLDVSELITAIQYVNNQF